MKMGNKSVEHAFWRVCYTIREYRVNGYLPPPTLILANYRLLQTARTGLFKTDRQRCFRAD